MTKLTAGEASPPFSLATDTHETLTSEDLKGTPFVIYFYPKDDTPGCTKEAIGFSALDTDFQNLGVKIIGVSKDTVAKHEKFRTKHALSILLGSDETGTVCDAFGIWKEKSMYGRTFMGIERTTFLVNKDGIIAKVWSRVKVNGHAEDVLSHARTLL